MNVLLEDVSMSYRTRNRAPRKVFSHLNLSIAAGETVGIIGPEGAGKSTLLQLMDGLHRPEAGCIRVGGRNLWGGHAAAKELRTHIAFSFQFPEQQFFCETVREELDFKLRNTGTGGDAREMLHRVGLDPESVLARSPFSLSMGEARRVALASVLVGQPELLLLDEPTAGLDGAGVQAILSILEKEFSGRTALIVSHDVDLLSDCVDRIVVMRGGEVIDDAAVGTFFAYHEKIEAAGYQLPEGMQIVEELRHAGVSLTNAFYRNREVERMLRSDPSLRTMVQR
jgi:energy-coupling factor transport system ATP-binding protein